MASSKHKELSTQVGRDNYVDLQRFFIAQRNAACLRKTDIAGILGVNVSTIIRAEEDRSGEVQWPRFFQSQKNIRAYVGNAGVAAQLALEKKVFDTFYPHGVASLRELVTCVAYKFDVSIAELGQQLEIPGLKDKLSGHSRKVLMPDEVVGLRAYLAPKLKYMTHLGVDLDRLDQLLPGPVEITQKGDADFSQKLNLWAQYATGTDICSFSNQVSEWSGKTYPPQAVYQWGKGQGLAAALPHILRALKENPRTCEYFNVCEADFIASAQEVIAPKSGLNISEAIRRSPTLGRALTVLEKHPSHPLTADKMLRMLATNFGCAYTSSDYEAWKAETTPNDKSFSGRLSEVIVEHLQETGSWLTIEAREHLKALALPGRPIGRDSWIGMVQQLGGATNERS